MMILATHVFDPLSRYVLQIGELSWYKYSLMILLGIVVAVVLGLIEGKKLGIKGSDILDGILIIVPLSIVGTRLWYVIFEFQERYLDDFQDGFFDGLLAIANISDGGLAIHGGFITAFVSAYFFTKRRGINLFSTFDIMVPGFLIAQAFGRWGNFFNQEAHGGMIGGMTNGVPNLDLDAQRSFLSNTLHLPNFITNQMLMAENEGFAVEGTSKLAAYYHPTFLYESVWNVVGFIIVLLLRRTKWVKNGEFLAFYLIWYGIGRFFIEGMRTDSLYVLDTQIRTAQLISIIMVLGAALYIYLVRKVFNNPPYCAVLKEFEGVDVDGNNKPNKTVKIFGEKSEVQNTNTNTEEGV